MWRKQTVWSLYWRYLAWYAILGIGCAWLAASPSASTHLTRWLVVHAGLFLAGTIMMTWYAASRMRRPLLRLQGVAADWQPAGGPQLSPLRIPDEWEDVAEQIAKAARDWSHERRQSREALERLTIVIDAMSEGVLAVDVHERILLANQAAARLLHFTQQQAVGRHLLEVVRTHRLQQAVRVTLDRDAAVEQRRQVSEMEVGGPTPHLLQVHATRLPGDPCEGVLLVLHDITELRRLEQLRQQFVANVSHELKTPLSAIKAYAETLREGAIDDPETSQRFIMRIEEQADRLHELILDMLSLARIESAPSSLEITPIHLTAAMAECLRHHQTAARAKQLDLEFAERPPDEVQVLADREGLRQVLDNLLDNAIKYTPDGGRIVFSARCEEGLAVIQVVDTGIGISAADQERVFERFYRVDRARSRELGSTGLGLSIVKHLLQSMGGQIELVSRLGQGSTFTVRLRLAELPATA